MCFCVLFFALVYYHFQKIGLKIFNPNNWYQSFWLWLRVMVDEDSSTHGIGKSDGKDFVFWRIQIEGYLYGKKLHLPLLRTKLERMLDGDWVPW